MSTDYWNNAFTSMVRKSNATLWGNWTLNPMVAAGAVGYIETNTGSFVHVSTLPGAKLITTAAPENWAVESSSAHRTETDVTFSGGYIDPSTGTKVTAGLEVGYNFSEENAIASNGTLTGRTEVNDFGNAMKSNFDWLLQEAGSVGYASNGGINQGFGMIVMTQNCIGGVNIGSLSKSSTFSITGSVDGINSMTGTGDTSAGLAGSYKSTNETASFESHLWPAESNEAAPNQIGMTFQFATFDGSTIMPNWIMPISSFEVNFDNAHGGTYIGKCTVKWNEPGSSSQKTKETSVSGGTHGTISGIPLTATNIEVTVDYEAGPSFGPWKWPNPIVTWLTGQQTFDLYGVWPFSHSVKLRTPETGFPT